MSNNGHKRDTRPYQAADVIEIEPKDYGLVTFQDGDTLPFLETEMIIGAIFSDDAYQYECTSQRALEKISGMARLQQTKISYLKKKNPACNYQPIKNSLGYLQSTDISDIPDRIDTLKKQNDALINDADCIQLI